MCFLQQCGVRVLFGQEVHEAPFFPPVLACQIKLTLFSHHFLQLRRQKRLSSMAG